MDSLATPPLDATTLTILTALASGCPATEVAALSGASPRTVRRRLAELRAAWGSQTNTGVVARAVRSGYI